MLTISLEQIVSLVIVAGEIMLKNGAETYRIEETMDHMAKACGALAVESFVIPTGVFLTVTDANGQTLTVMRRVSNRTINLDRISKVNELSRRLVDQRMEYRDAKKILEHISKERTGFSLLPSMLASGTIGAGTAILQDALLPEVVVAFMAAAIVRYIAHIISRLHGLSFSFEFLGGMAVAFCGTLLHSLLPHLRPDAVIIGGIMPLVPGVAITNAIRDVIAGDLLSGLSRGLEAALTSVAVAMGVVIMLALTV
ncbi:threonine/serine exporter family protein [Pelosinus sp. IPA-1]|uniref:threonine/serine exporter family protein n=1 Tax=Pelosinus sp. IPA-1 TaxID=3029569 RepID=UPI0024362216|nr:threonine/serine exporter family protein [Pelosinus sp. IPA-1]GMA99118.1 membrane protein [Pelosinus sp. IPA-1]